MSEVKKLRRRDEIPESDKWRIDKIYETPAKWNEELSKLKEEAPKLKDFEGKLGNKEDLKAFLLLNEKLSRKLGKLYVYAHMRSHEDTSNPEMQSLVNKIDPYSAEFSSYTAYFVPEILSLKEGTIENFINEDKDLKQYKIYFEMILNEKPHILSKEVESVLASVSDCLGAPESIYSMLTNSDMTFGEIVDESSRKVELTEGNYISFIKSKDRKVREAAFKLLFGTYKKYENTLATSLTSSIKNFVFESKTRKYNSSLEASLKPNNIPVEVYYNALKTVDENMDALHRYVRIKKKLLNLEEIHMYDLYVPVIECKKEHLEYKDAISLVEEGLKPLGKEYLDIFNEGINEGWIDVYENKGKRSGAYSWGSTLAHEMGHSIHSYYTRKTQPYIYGDYSLFCAEVASTTNEILLIHHLIEKETDKNKKLYLINQELEQIRTTVFRQLMFAEFELKTHEAIENGESLTSEVLCKMWKDINIKYFGEDMNVDEEISIEWARIPHFYSDFYVYQYATGYAAASSFANSILSKGEEAVEKYKGFLKAGGSMYPIDTLKMAGVDMTTSKPLKDTLDRFNELLDMLEEII